MSEEGKKQKKENNSIASLMKKIEESKKQYEQAIDAIQDSICVINKNFEITSCNKAFAKSVNLPIKMIKGLFCRNVVPCFSGNLFFEHCNLANEEGTCHAQKVFSEKKTVHFVQKYDDKFGKEHYYRFNLFPIKNKENTVDQVVILIRDISEGKKAENIIIELNKDLEKKVEKRTKELDEANKELQKVLELKSEFMTDASHELRTPLTIIQGNIDLEIQELKNKDSKIPEFYSVIQKELSRMTGILNDLTNLTHYDAKTDEIEEDILSLNILTKTAIKTLSVLAQQKNINLNLSKNNANINLIGDEQKLEILLLNIIRNAIKYTNSGGYINVKIRKEKDIAKIIVEDSGIGIPEKDLPYIFERFYRVDKARSRQEGGTGLGLSICKYIAESHGGAICVESKENEGSKFTLRLPIRI